MSHHAFGGAVEHQAFETGVSPGRNDDQVGLKGASSIGNFVEWDAGPNELF